VLGTPGSLTSVLRSRAPILCRGPTTERLSFPIEGRIVCRLASRTDGEHARNRRPVADIAVHHVEQRANGFLVSRDAVEIVDLSKPPRADRASISRSSQRAATRPISGFIISFSPCALLSGWAALRPLVQAAQLSDARGSSQMLVARFRTRSLPLPRPIGETPCALQAQPW